MESTTSLKFLDALNISELPEGTNKAITLFGQSLLVCHSGGVFYTVANRCSHQQQPLEGGRLRGSFLFCPLHGVRFDLRSGMPTGTLTRTPIKTWPTRVEGERVQIAQPPDSDE